MANNNLHPDLRPTVDLGKFRFWCQKVLPLVYDDSISYYEVLGKMVTYLNQVIDNVNADTENVQTLKEAFDALAEYIDQIGEIDIRELTQLIQEGVEAAEEALSSAQAAHSSAENASASATNAADAAILASNSAESAAGSAQNASASATNAANSALNAINQAESASTSATAAQGSAATASAASTSANADALKAEGLAVGQQNGVDVGSSSPYYHKNAKYYAEQAGQGAGAYPLADLPDTAITNPSNGQVLMYNQTAGKWVNSAENEIAVSQTAPSSPDTKMWINETAQTPVVIPTMADLEDVEDDITTINNTISSMQTTLNGKADSTTVSTGLASKADKTAYYNITAPTTLTVADNSEYLLNNVSNLTIVFPSGRFECWIRFATLSNFTGVTFPETTKYIGGMPDFGANERWEVSIKNDVIVAGKVE